MFKSLIGKTFIHAETLDTILIHSIKTYKGFTFLYGQRYSDGEFFYYDNLDLLLW